MLGLPWAGLQVGSGWGSGKMQPRLVSQLYTQTLVSQGRSNGVGSSFLLSCFMLSLVFHGHL